MPISIDASVKNKLVTMQDLIKISVRPELSRKTQLAKAGAFT
jgi:hypothetical protein